MRTSNPAFRWRDLAARGASLDDGEARLTLRGATIKSALLGWLMTLMMVFAWQHIDGRPNMAAGLAACGLACTLVLAVGTVTRPAFAIATAPLCALCEGLFLGSMSAYLETIRHGLGVALLGTVAVFVVTLWLFRSGAVVPSERLRTTLIALTGGMFVLYMMTFAVAPLNLGVPVLLHSTPFVLVMSALLVGLASLNLVLDYQSVLDHEGLDELPAWMEWYVGFGLLFSLLWMYPETVRMLARLHAWMQPER